MSKHVPQSLLSVDPSISCPKITVLIVRQKSLDTRPFPYSGVLDLWNDKSKPLDGAILRKKTPVRLQRIRSSSGQTVTKVILSFLINHVEGLTISGNGKAVLVNDPMDKKITVFERWDLSWSCKDVIDWERFSIIQNCWFADVVLGIIWICHLFFSQRFVHVYLDFLQHHFADWKFVVSNVLRYSEQHSENALCLFIFVSCRQDNGTLKLSATIPLPVAIDQVLSL